VRSGFGASLERCADRLPNIVRSIPAPVLGGAMTEGCDRKREQLGRLHRHRVRRPPALPPATGVDACQGSAFVTPPRGAFRSPRSPPRGFVRWRATSSKNDVKRGMSSAAFFTTAPAAGQLL
jgi:hypothetical protein